jgi:Kef-type K+ transport system membrane component KefB
VWASGSGDDAGHEDHSLIHRMMLMAFQLGVIIIAAKLGGELFERVLRMPAVLGELASGLLIGPYALGGFLFVGQAADPGVVPVSEVIWGLATLASIILLFLAGLETDFRQFMRYAGPGGLVGIGGVVGAFATGDLLTVFFAKSFDASWGVTHPIPLFMGTISVATSVGITARVLSEKGKLDSPEGVTILAGAVIDDVLGIIVLAVVLGLAKPGAADVHWTAVAGKAVGIWIAATIVMILLAKPIKRVLGIFRGEGVVPGLALGIALLLAGLMESAGLAMIIGAYVAGLALAKEQDLAHRLDRQLRPLYNVIVPVFFCVMGMLVDFDAMGASIVFGLVFSGVAIVSKVVGCGLPTYLVKFNTRGALRVGFGMLPRGEVALIVAGVGLTGGILIDGDLDVSKEMFGVAIMMTLITTVMAPPILVKLFEGGPGIRGAEPVPEEPHREVVWRTRELAPRRLALVMGTLVGALREREDYDVSRVSPESEIFLVTAAEDEFDFQVVKAEDHVEVHASPPDEERAVGVTRSAIAEARAIFEDIAQEP